MVLRNPDSFSCESVDMEKLVQIRNAHLVRVRGELAAAENLAGRKATVGEAQDRLNLLRELAGDFRRTQTAIEEEEENSEASAAMHDYREEFNESYYSAMNILEKHVTANKPAKSGFRTDGNKPIDNERDIRDAMRLFLETQRATMKDLLGPDLEEMLDQADRLLSSGDAKKDVSKKLAYNNNKPEAQPGNGNGADVPAETLRGIDGHLPQARIPDDLDFEASLLTFEDQEEVPKPQQLTPSGQTATVLTQDKDGRFIVRLPVDDSKSTTKVTNNTDSQEPTNTNGIATDVEVTFAAGKLLRRHRSVDAMDRNRVPAGIRKAELQAKKAKWQVGVNPTHTCLSLSKRITFIREPAAIHIPLRLQNKWQLMHSPTSEIWSRSVKEVQVGEPWSQISYDDEGVIGNDRRRPDGDTAESRGESRAKVLKGLRADIGLRHSCLKAGEYVPTNLFINNVAVARSHDNDSEQGLSMAYKMDLEHAYIYKRDFGWNILPKYYDPANRMFRYKSLDQSLGRYPLIMMAKQRTPLMDAFAYTLNCFIESGIYKLWDNTVAKFWWNLRKGTEGNYLGELNLDVLHFSDLAPALLAWQVKSDATLPCSLGATSKLIDGIFAV
ncbi:conserved hypothetical protein [Culex quinquefasciatus]|uniref:Uncharacterized protein n=1 Tax=Culex quinquefasciatus TaxID=7176 RepID=B0XFP8_CULQU|nr:conserved hypothetical protein [Culex quinquefasciatus]|eukprot:XP_001868470.1 conserved hypothetical protein [Culex quinquefasciatus]